jgi:tight adherence protein C
VVAYLVIGLIFVAVAVAGVLASVSARRLRTVQRLATIEEYGFASQPAPIALVEEPGGNPVKDLVTRLGDVVGRRLGGLTDEAIRAELMKAGMYFTSPRTILGYRILAAIILPVAAVALNGASGPLDIAMIVLVMVIGWLIPVVLVRRRARLRLTDIERRLPDLIDLLCVMVEAGLGFRAALRMSSEQFKGPLSDELRLTLQEQTMGLDVTQALSNMAGRCQTPAVMSFVRAMSQGERMGISTGQIMRSLAHEMRLRRRQSAEERAQKAPVKMLFPLAFLIFPAMFIVIITPAVINLLHAFNG